MLVNEVPNICPQAPCSIWQHVVCDTAWWRICGGKCGGLPWMIDHDGEVGGGCLAWTGTNQVCYIGCYEIMWHHTTSQTEPRHKKHWAVLQAIISNIMVMALFPSFPPKPIQCAWLVHIAGPWPLPTASGVMENMTESYGGDMNGGKDSCDRWWMKMERETKEGAQKLGKSSNT